jgi:hypothetical protein
VICAASSRVKPNFSKASRQKRSNWGTVYLMDFISLPSFHIDNSIVAHTAEKTSVFRSSLLAYRSDFNLFLKENRYLVDFRSTL